MILQAILNKLKNLGYSGGYEGLSSMTGEDWSGLITNKFNLKQGDIPSDLFTPFTGGDLALGYSKEYSPIRAATQESLAGELAQAYGGKAYKQAMGGFASTGAVDVFGKQIGSEYRKGMSDILTETSGAQTQNLQNILDRLTRMEETGGSIAGYPSTLT